MFLLNPLPQYGQPLDAQVQARFGVAAALSATQCLARRPDYAITPLHEMRALADSLRAGAVYLKDESARLGMNSFKALGGYHAIARLVAEVAENTKPESLTFCCATDGNHGRGVADAARLFGARAVVFVHEGVNALRRLSITRAGAAVVSVPGRYDDAVAEARRVAAERGWTVVSDTGYSGYERIPTIIMQGYLVLVHEALAQMPAPPTHVFVQAGVGGLAAAVAAHLRCTLADSPATRIIVVEPSRAACLLESAAAGARRRIPAQASTAMEMLECFEPSLPAWNLLACTADAFMAVDDEQAVHAVARLSSPSSQDAQLLTTASGAAGVAGLIAAASSPTLREALHLDDSSRIFVINTEGPCS